MHYSPWIYYYAYLILSRNNICDFKFGNNNISVNDLVQSVKWAMVFGHSIINYCKTTKQFILFVQTWFVVAAKISDVIYLEQRWSTRKHKINDQWLNDQWLNDQTIKWKFYEFAKVCNGCISRILILPNLFQKHQKLKTLPLITVPYSFISTINFLKNS